MGKHIKQFLILAAIVVGATILSINFYVEYELKRMPPKTEFIREFTPEETWMMHLLAEIQLNGLAFRDFRILKEVNKCESGWRQFWQDGKPIISSGNIGIAQINKLAHEAEYRKLELDVEDPFDNLTYQVLLYKREGLNPWRKWSGSCWEKNIKKL